MPTAVVSSTSPSSASPELNWILSARAPAPIRAAARVAYIRILSSRGNAGITSMEPFCSLRALPQYPFSVRLPATERVLLTQFSPDPTSRTEFRGLTPQLYRIN